MPDRPDVPAARLVCCGLTTLDVVQVVDAVPGPDQKVVARDLHVTFGGPAANAAATAVALGVPTTLVTALGEGPIADLVRAGLRAAGVDVVDLLAGQSADPPVSTVLVTAATGQRAVASTNATGRPDDLGPAAGAALDVLAGATALLVDGHHLSAARVLASAAHARSVPVLLDGGSWKPGLDGLLVSVDVAVLSGDFRLPGRGDDTSDALLDDVAALGPSVVARSSGSGPVRVRVPAGHDEVVPPALPPDDVVDTLGAGDVLHGAIGAGLARGLDPVAALREAVPVATESCRHAGALGWVRAARGV
ncbi:PfkB family carbohydrate kinase [Cellulomonas sp. SG140]|uniref:PfkB family carbohydrate kinase n=1 Tax=Cellulomonas sp. SG140 TaxID=2976536 RepID=UPI0021E8BD53|nr:PfkB family carbohydrate kinase [Cellulomonas sp. SG140]